MQCSRHSSGTGVLASIFLSMPMAWLSEYLDIFMQNLIVQILRGNPSFGTFLFLEELPSDEHHALMF
jgi:hypothetical protein